jgi:hypothetical protein
MFSHRRRLSTILEEEGSETKRCKLSFSASEWKIVFELEEQEYQLIQMRAQIALDELFGLVFDYRSGQIYSILADVVFVQCESEFSVSGMDQETLRKLQKISNQFNYFALEAVLAQFSYLIPIEIAEILDQIVHVFSAHDECLPGVMRLVLSCLPLSKFKCLAMISLFLRQFQKQVSTQLASSCLNVSITVCSFLVNYWESIFLLPSSQQ